MKLTEGMWANDLEDLLQPYISIDEYQSKVDDSAIAVGFYVSDRDAADDLNRFIQKSAVPIIDSDVSPAPDQRGFYIVFAEISSNDRFSDNLMNLCEEVGQLGAISNWLMRVRGNPKSEPINPKKVRLMVLRNRIKDRLAKIEREIEDLIQRRK